MQNSPPTGSAAQNPGPQQVQQLIRLYSEGKLQEALAQTELLLRDFSNSSFLYNIQGASQAGLGQFAAAIDSYRQALRVEPNDAKTHFNLANAQSNQGELDAAIASYKQALKIDPSYTLAYNNLGNTQKDAGELSQAIGSYRRALAIDPNIAELHCNLGNALKDAGELDQAIASYERALQIQPGYAEAHNNLGSALNENGDVSRARRCFEQALNIRPDYAAAAWNMVGTATDSPEAATWVRECLASDRGFLEARFLQCVLHYYNGDRTSFDELMGSSMREHPTARSIDWVSKLAALPKLYFNRWAFFDGINELSEKERPFYEFGVFRGVAFRYLIETFKRGYGFDTFEGIPEDWHDEKAGSYSSGGSIPRIAGGEFIAGRFEDTLPAFFSEARPIASVINFDADLYSSTLCALNNARPVIDDRTILIFDEFIVNEHWEQDEYRALNEFCTAHELSYEVLAVSFFTKQVALRLVGL